MIAALRTLCMEQTGLSNQVESNILPTCRTMTDSESEDGRSDAPKGDDPKKRPATSSLEEDTDEKRQARREANRMHAFKSRQRSKMLLQELQQTVDGLSKDKSELERQNAVLRAQVEVLQQQNAGLMQNQQMLLTRVGGGIPGPVPSGMSQHGNGGNMPSFSQMLPLYAHAPPPRHTGPTAMTAMYGMGDSSNNQEMQQFVNNFSPQQFQQLQQQSGQAVMDTTNQQQDPKASSEDST